MDCVKLAIFRIALKALKHRYRRILINSSTYNDKQSGFARRLVIVQYITSEVIQ